MRPLRPRRGLRDHSLGRLALLVLVLVAALLVARTCGSQNRNVSKDEAIALASQEAGFEPCAQPRCVQIRFLQRGIPIRGYWLVGLAPALDENGDPVRSVSLLVDVQTGAIARP
ncbi:MAG TPA: hypothetical protein VNJ53_05020 [Gaiellaceae bacterium]|nr:hypothetical protein [Gaiellaceae bacterium]